VVTNASTSEKQDGAIKAGGPGVVRSPPALMPPGGGTHEGSPAGVVGPARPPHKGFDGVTLEDLSKE